MQALKLTPKQKEVFDMLSTLKGAVLFKHVKPSGTMCYRVLDAEKRPVMNLQMHIVDALISKDVLDRNGNEYVLKATTEKKDDSIYENIGLSKTKSYVRTA